MSTVIAAIILLLSVVLSEAEDLCLPELIKSAETSFEGKDITFNPCPLDETSPLIIAAIGAIFANGTIISDSCIVTVNPDSLDCDSKEKKMGRKKGKGRKGKGRKKKEDTKNTEMLFDVEIEFQVSINCSSDPCDTNTSDAEDRALLISTTNDLNTMFPRGRIQGVAGEFVFNDTTFNVDTRKTRFSRGVIALCNGSMVVDDNLMLSETATTDDTDDNDPADTSGSKGKKGSKGGRKAKTPKRGKRPKSGSMAEDTVIPFCSEF